MSNAELQDISSTQGQADTYEFQKLLQTGTWSGPAWRREQLRKQFEKYQSARSASEAQVGAAQAAAQTGRQGTILSQQINEAAKTLIGSPMNTTTILGSK